MPVLRELSRRTVQPTGKDARPTWARIDLPLIGSVISAFVGAVILLWIVGLLSK